MIRPQSLYEKGSKFPQITNTCGGAASVSQGRCCLWWRSAACGRCDAAQRSLFRLHFEKLKRIPVLELDASEEFQSDPEVQEEFIRKVFLFVVCLYKSCPQVKPHKGLVPMLEVLHLHSVWSKEMYLCCVIWCLMCCVSDLLAILKYLFLHRWKTSSKLYKKTSPVGNVWQQSGLRTS